MLDGWHLAMERNQAAPTTAPAWPLSEGEVNVFYWFIQGSIINPETRWRMRDAWGFCQRHTWAHLAVETSFRRRFVLGPAILYEDLMERCLGAFAMRGPWQTRRLAQPALAGVLEALGEFARPEAIPRLIEALGDDLGRPAAATALRKLAARRGRRWSKPLPRVPMRAITSTPRACAAAAGRSPCCSSLA